MEQNASSPQPVSEPIRDKAISKDFPLARLALRVGVTGHRPNKLQNANEEQLRKQIRTALQFLKDTTIQQHAAAGPLYLPDPVLRVISPLAEGSDRLVAEVGLDLGFELQCPLPFPREEYEQDFESEDSRKRFRELLDQATAVLELDGSRDTSESGQLENESYEAAGRIVLNQSDVVLAIWDGEPGKKGGTGQIVAEAEQLGIPIIWIESTAPHNLSVKLPKGLKPAPWQTSSHLVSERIGNLLAPPPQAKAKHDKEKPKVDLREAYFTELQRKFTFGFGWKLFRDLVADLKIKIPKIKLEPFEHYVTEEWGRARKILPTLPLRVLDRIDAELSRHYAWADQLANYYADAYRSAFVINYLMGGLAVLFAFISYVAHTRNLPEVEANKLGAIASAFEVVIILTIIFLTVFGNLKRWHERWIDYRLLAEQIRMQRFLMSLGTVLPSAPGVSLYVSDDDPINSWIQWHFRAIVRAAGVIEARFDTAYLSAAGLFVKAEGIDQQVSYHQVNAERLQRADKFLHVSGYLLFALAAAACTLHLINYVPLSHQHLFAHEGRFALVLTFITVVGPAFGAALTAIRFQGEFERVSKRSLAMKGQLQQLSAELENCLKPGGRLSSRALGEISIRGAQLMISEVLDWRTVFRERPLGLPS